MLEAVRSYKPHITDRSSRFAQAEYASFMFFWLQHWHDQQPPLIRDYGLLLKILMAKAKDGAIAIRIYQSLNIENGWDPDLWFEDRLRMYRNIANTEPQCASEQCPPSIFKACHMLATLSARSNSLEMHPSVDNSADLLDLCLSQNIFPDALEQFNLYSHATSTLSTTLPALAEIVTEIHLRRLANLESKNEAAPQRYSSLE